MDKMIKILNIIQLVMETNVIIQTIKIIIKMEYSLRILLAQEWRLVNHQQAVVSKDLDNLTKVSIHQIMVFLRTWLDLLSLLITTEMEWLVPQEIVTV